MYHAAEDDDRLFPVKRVDPGDVVVGERVQLGRAEAEEVTRVLRERVRVAKAAGRRRRRDSAPKAEDAVVRIRGKRRARWRGEERRS